MSTIMRKAFHISDVLSAYSGYLVSTRGMDGVYEILNFLTQDNLFTHQLPRAMDECKGWLKKQHPQLEEIDCAELTPETLSGWVERTVAKYGETLEIEPLPKDAHEYREPVEELKSMVDADRVIVIRIDGTPQ